MSSSKSKDKFYTVSEVAQKFVSKVNQIFPFDEFDEIIEPSAGNGTILKFLPEGSIGLDLYPEAEGIKEQDFFLYENSYCSLTNRKRILTIGNPPFGKGYMNPLAKGFFNKAAEFSEVIAFIIPAKWHTAWKIHFQLNDDFGLYYSEVLPKNSFVLDGKSYDVPCCFQIWSRVPHKTLKDIRIRQRPKTKHPDFEMFLTCDNVPALPTVREQIAKQEYWDFGFKYWGNIHVCEFSEVPVNTTSHYLIKSNQPYVREIMEMIAKDWKKYVNNMGAPNLGGKSILISLYEKVKNEYLDSCETGTVLPQSTAECSIITR